CMITAPDITAPDRGEAPPKYHLPTAPPYISSTRHEIPPATPRAVAPPAAAVHRQDAARGLATAHQPLRIAAGAEPRSLGAAGAGHRGRVFHLDRRQFAAPSGYEGLREDKPAAAVRRPTRNSPR